MPTCGEPKNGRITIPIPIPYITNAYLWIMYFGVKKEIEKPKKAIHKENNCL